MPKIIGGSLREHREQTRDKLFDALSSLMADQRFESITLADIATTAGVGRTAVYNHFADKETLLVEFVAHETHEYAAALQRGRVTMVAAITFGVETVVPALIGLALLGDRARPGFAPVAAAGFVVTVAAALALARLAELPDAER